MRTRKKCVSLTALRRFFRKLLIIKKRAKKCSCEEKENSVDLCVNTYSISTASAADGRGNLESKQQKPNFSVVGSVLFFRGIFKSDDVNQPVSKH